jgi:hypothetical protein
MNNIEKKLDALIDAMGFDVEEVLGKQIPSGQIIVDHDYKLTKRKIIDRLVVPLCQKPKKTKFDDCADYKQTMFGIDLNLVISEKSAAKQLIEQLAMAHCVGVSIDE